MFGILRRKSPAKASAPAVSRLHEVAGRTLPLNVVENARARRLTLRILPNGNGLRVTVPPGLSAREVESFLSRQRGWLEQRLSKLPENALVRPGIKIPIRGKPHRIVHDPALRGTTRQSEIDGEPILIVHGAQERIPARVAAYLKREAKQDIEQLVARHTATVGRKARSISYRDTSSRWGSCSSSGALSFSWRIMMAPPPIIDYLVAHEVAHLREMNHGPKFWKLCETLCPDTQRCRDWLKRNGSALQAIGFGEPPATKPRETA